MRSIDFAIGLQTEILAHIQRVSPVSVSVIEVISVLTQTEERLLAVLEQAAKVDDDLSQYPIIDTATILGPETSWTAITEAFAQSNPKPVQDLTLLWMIFALLDNSTQYYYQSSANHPHPSGRLYFRSLYEVSSMIRRRFDGILRIAHNDVWAKLGYPPTTLGKE